MDALPDELLCLVFDHLGRRWLSIASLACYQWRSCARSVAATRRHDLVVPPDTMHEATNRGYASLVVWLQTQLGHPWTAETLVAAAQRGHFHLVDCMCAVRASAPPCRMDERVAAAAIAGGGSRMLRKVRRHGCPWGPAAVTVAVVLDDWESLRVLAAGGCTYDALTVIAAVALRRWHVVKKLGFGADDIAEAAATLADVAGDFDKSCLVPCLRCDARAFIANVSAKHLVDYLVYGGPFLFVGRRSRRGHTRLEANAKTCVEWSALRAHRWWSPHFNPTTSRGRATPMPELSDADGKVVMRRFSWLDLQRPRRSSVCVEVLRI
ncbi:F-box domain containing protein [Pandoravirus salinus]|uniref:F-box domain containing protein n=1 Tax=Pandoravirus salinus TaxID=1349410 RepID=A0A291ATL2_9VIRU|nr:F-box domain [Pandoravirus salinus]ATE82223.1 F-box domain containing protein [Pandoravirus salinus]